MDLGMISMRRNDLVQLIQGDCLEKMKDIRDKSIDMILCDLPYGTTQNKWDCPINLQKLWGEYRRIIKNDGVMALFAQLPFDKILGNSAIDILRYEWVWEKNKATGHLNAKKMPMKAHENILIFYKKLPFYSPQGLVEKTTPTINKGNRGSKERGAGGDNYGKSDRDALQTHSGYPRDILKFSVDESRVSSYSKTSSIT